MVRRTYWLDLLARAWKRRSLIWVSGVRRAGKTCLAQSVEGALYLDCELPSVRRRLSDPELFWKGLRGKTVVLDEIHRLGDATSLLKIAADHHPTVRVLATGSATLAASARFKDTLAGRKTDIWLTPMISRDLRDFGRTDLEHRLLRGGLPSFFLDEELPERDYQEWVDAYWAKDVQELFRLERRSSFARFLELLLAQSGGLFEATRFAAPCEISRTTVTNYLSVLEATHIAHVIRPFSLNKPAEITSAPKVYGFDTGFVSCHRGLHELRPTDLGGLWEHFVLDELHARLQRKVVRYWRDKRGHEVDFVLAPRGRPPIALECKWSAGSFHPRNLAAFRRQHPDGENWVVCHDVEDPFSQRMGDLEVEFLGVEEAAARASRMP